MDSHYSRAVESDAAERSPRELLQSPVTVLLGVDEEARRALGGIDVETVHDLATSPTFEVARAVTETAVTGAPSGGTERTTARTAANRRADGDVAALAAADVVELEGIDRSAADALRDALGVRTVRDLARWPPYDAARAILGALTGEDAETDRGVPEELVPVARKYGTEETFYTKVYVDQRVTELEAEEPDFGPLDREDLYEEIREHGPAVDWTPQWRRIAEALEEDDGEQEEGESGEELPRTRSLLLPDRAEELADVAVDRRVDVTEADPDVGGFRQPAVGGVIQFSQTWVPQGLSLGQLLHSTTLAPGESTKVAVIDWSRRTRGEREEAESQRERTEAGLVQNRSIREVQNGVTSEVQHGRSMVSSESTSTEHGDTRNRGAFGTGGSHTWAESTSTSETATVSTSMGRREVHADMTQKIRNATQQHASASRTRRATVVRETEQTESEEVRTRVVTNHNHMHALSVHYYEVVQVFRVEVGPEDARPVLFVPFEPLDFTDTELIFRYRQALLDAALDETTREMIDQATGFVDLRTDFDLGAGRSGSSLDAHLRRLGAERTGSAAVSMPGDDELTRVDFEGPLSTITIHRDEGADEVVRSGGGTVYRPDAPVAFDDVDMISVEITEEWEPPEDELDRTIVLEAEGPFRTSDYSITVTGDIEQAQDEVEGFSVSAQPTDTVQGDTASGQVHVGRDGFRFSGDIDQWLFSNPDVLTVYVDGDRWDFQDEDPPTPERTRTVDVSLGVRRPDGTEAQVFGTIGVAPGTDEFRLADVSGADTLAELTRRLQEEQLHYSQAVWRSLDPQTMTMLLGNFEIDQRSAAEFVDPTPEAVHGNYVAFPLSIPEDPGVATDETYAKLAAWWDRWRVRNFDPNGEQRDLVPLPSGGVHGESILGRANAAEKLDITRFWDWQESPIPQQAPEIAPVETGSRAGDQDLTPGGFDSPIVQMQQPQQLPDPAGIGAALDVLGQSGIFRDMSGMEAAADVARTTSEIAGKGSRHAADAAVETFKAGARAQNRALSTVADTITSLAGGGGFSAANAGNSSFGAALNEAKRMDGTVDAGGSDGRAGGSDGGAGSDSGPTGNGRGGGGAGSGSGGGSGGSGRSDGAGGSLARDMLRERAMPADHGGGAGVADTSRSGPEQAGGPGDSTDDAGRSYIISGPGVSADRRAFAPSSNDKSGTISLSVRVPDLPQGGTIRWSVPPSARGDVALGSDPSNPRTAVEGRQVTVMGLTPGLTELDVSVLDDAGEVIESVKYDLSVPVFVEVSTDSSFGNVLSNFDLEHVEEAILEEAKAASQVPLEAANVRVVWATQPFGESLPPQFTGGGPASGNVTTATLEGAPNVQARAGRTFAGSSGNIGPNTHDETIEIWVGAFDDEPVGSTADAIDEATRQAVQTVKNANLGDPDVLGLAIKLLGRLTGEALAHEIGHSMIGGGHNPSGGLMRDGDNRPLADRTGLSGGTSSPDPSTIVDTITDTGIGGINAPDGSAKNLIDRNFPVPPVFN